MSGAKCYHLLISDNINKKASMHFSVIRRDKVASRSI